MTAPIIDPVERAHMAWESASVNDEPVDKQTWMIIVAGVARQAAAAERQRCAYIVATKSEESRDTEFDLGFETARKVFAAAILNPNN